MTQEMLITVKREYSVEKDHTIVSKNDGTAMTEQEQTQLIWYFDVNGIQCLGHNEYSGIVSGPMYRYKEQPVITWDISRSEIQKDVGQIAFSMSNHTSIVYQINNIGRITDPKHWSNNIDDLNTKRNNAKTKSTRSYWNNKMIAMFKSAWAGVYNLESGNGKWVIMTVENTSKMRKVLHDLEQVYFGEEWKRVHQH